MIAILDRGEAREVLTELKVIFGDGCERHVTITHEGIVVDLIVGGKVVGTRKMTHAEILGSELLPEEP